MSRAISRTWGGEGFFLRCHLHSTIHGPGGPWVQMVFSGDPESEQIAQISAPRSRCWIDFANCSGLLDSLLCPALGEHKRRTPATRAYPPCSLVSTASIVGDHHQLCWRGVARRPCPALRCCVPSSSRWQKVSTRRACPHQSLAECFIRPLPTDDGFKQFGVMRHHGTGGAVSSLDAGAPRLAATAVQVCASSRRPQDLLDTDSGCRCMGRSSRL